MGSDKEDYSDTASHYYKRFWRRVKKPWIACLGSFSISIVGGLIFTWWELWYHPTNSQLWMVPFSLVLFITPVIIWFSIFVSDLLDNPHLGEETSSSLGNVQSGDIP